ncbi:MAG: hypothetical protein K8R87_09380 [Verrucomicrobia bacterium]|nr:hypothetical protein [Verrucomicrobiota bacterium]
MWLCTRIGFFSIVQKDADCFHIRARCREDLDELVLAAGMGTPVVSYKGSDYPWRIICEADELPWIMKALTGSIDYGNFKSVIAANPDQRSKVSAYHDIHHRMVEWQEKNA